MEGERQIDARSVTVDRVLMSSDGRSAKLIQITQKEGFSTIESGRYEVDGESVICLSAQIGCGMECSFCRSTDPFEFYPGEPRRVLRSLDGQEIIDQAINAAEAVPPPLESRGIVLSFMGMGEPFANIESIKEAILGLGSLYPESRATLSTTGFDLKGVLQLGTEISQGAYPIPVKLHISLQAPTDEQRKSLMPYASPVVETIDTAEEFAKITNTKVKLNYVLMRGFNDSEVDAQKLSQLLHGRKGLILKISDLNSGDIDMQVSPVDADKFDSKLKALGVETCRFWSEGKDISAGCGELVKGRIQP